MYLHDHNYFQQNDVHHVESEQFSTNLFALGNLIDFIDSGIF